MNSERAHSSYSVRIIWLDAEAVVQVNTARSPTVADLRDSLLEVLPETHTAECISESLVIDGREFAPHVLLDECPLFEGVEVGPAAKDTREASSYSALNTPETYLSATDFQAAAILADDGMLAAATGSSAPSAIGSAAPRSVLAVIGGIDSGQQIGLGSHPVVVGRSSAADLRIDHPEVSQRHMQIQHRQVLDLDSSNGVTIEGRSTADRVEIEPEQRIGIGGAVVTWRLLEDDSLEMSGSPPKLMFNRPPRSLPPAPAQPFRLAGKRSDGGLLPVRPPTWATFAIPLALGLVLAVLFNPYMALFALLGPAMAVSSWLEGRGRNKKDIRSRKRQTAKDREAFKAHCQRAAAQEAARRRFEHPDPAACLQWAVAPATRLWERSRTDDDFLHLSIGRYDASWQPPVDIAGGGGSASGSAGDSAGSSTSQVPEELADLRDSTTLPEVPFIADFSKGVIGIVGPRREALARWLVMQAATRYGPSDLNIAVTGNEKDWGWVSWLPHFRSAAGGNSATGKAVGNSAAGSSAVGNSASNLAAGNLIDDNLAAGNSAGSSSSSAEHTLAVWAHPSAGFAGDREAGRFAGDRIGGRRSGGGTEVWANSAANSSGASLLILAETSDELPSDCSVSIQLLDDAGRCKVTGWPRTVLADGISRATARQAALQLARFEDPLSNTAGLPQTISLLSLLGLRSVNDICAERAQQEWNINSMAAPIGWSDGEIVYLNLPADGPHGLIAGTTGSGKSELMRCLVASLAFTASPEQLNFVLIDYKGGSAFDACAGLPHVVGLVTDLDERLGERALVCLRAELAYREQFLRDAQAASISELPTGRSPGLSSLLPSGGEASDANALGGLSSSRSSLLPSGGEAGIASARNELSLSRSPLPRLVVVIDEFAALASELPGFLESLVDIAQRGRSLGVHLLLGTQRPAGVVSPSIRSNTNIRIGLRMLDPHDSEDVIGTPAAAGIEQGSPGRAYVRYGSGQPMPFQVAAVSGISPSPSDKPVVVETAAVESRMAMQTEGSRTEGFEAGSYATEAKTDLQRLVAAIGKAWEQTESQPLRCPWPEPLPNKLDLEELREQMASVGSGEVASFAAGAVALGLEDHPEEQTQRICFWYPAEKNLLLIGLTGSGASETLLTAVLQMAKARDASALQIFGIDYGTSNLSQLADLPHCQSILGPAEAGQRTELLEFMFQELAERQTKGRGVSPEVEDRAEREVADALVSNVAPHTAGSTLIQTEKQTADALVSNSFAATTSNREVGGREVGNRAVKNREAENKSAPPQTLLLIDNLGALLHALEDERDYRRIEKLTRLYLDGPSWGITTVTVAESLAAVPRKFFSAATMQLLFRVSDSSPYGPANIDASRLGFGRAFLIGGGAAVGGALVATGGVASGGMGGRGGTAGPVEVQAAVVPNPQKAISEIKAKPSLRQPQTAGIPDPQKAISDITQDLAELATP